MIDEKVHQAVMFLAQQPALYLLGGCGAAVVLLVGAWLVTIRRLVRRRTQAIEEARSREESLRKEAEAANCARAQFLANMSHEIKTPMNAIVGFTELALKRDLDPELREYFATVRTSADWLMHMLSDLLEFSRIEAGRLQLEKTTFSLADCIHSTIKIVQAEAAARGLTVRYKIDGQIPPDVRGDPMRLRQILFHLLDNAVKFTTSGGIMLTAALDSKSSDAVLVRISVADTGIGIPMQLQKHLLEPFRLQESNDDPQPGVGLGIAIASKLAELMGGTMEFTSQLGAGTTFQFTAWFEKVQRKPEAEKPTAASPLAPKQISVLVAEDNAVSRRLITKVLESADHRVVPVANGREAVDKFETEIFDLILMDMQMPDMDGLEATRAIRRNEPKGSHIAIYALTAHTSQSDREKCVEAGMDGFIAKPIEIDDVLRSVSEVASSGHRQVARPEPVADLA